MSSNKRKSYEIMIMLLVINISPSIIQQDLPTYMDDPIIFQMADSFNNNSQ